MSAQMPDAMNHRVDSSQEGRFNEATLDSFGISRTYPFSSRTSFTESSLGFIFPFYHSGDHTAIKSLYNLRFVWCFDSISPRPRWSGKETSVAPVIRPNQVRIKKAILAWTKETQSVTWETLFARYREVWGVCYENARPHVIRVAFDRAFQSLETDGAIKKISSTHYALVAKKK